MINESFDIKDLFHFAFKERRGLSLLIIISLISLIILMLLYFSLLLNQKAIVENKLYENYANIMQSNLSSYEMMMKKYDSITESKTLSQIQSTLKNIKYTDNFLNYTFILPIYTTFISINPNEISYEKKLDAYKIIENARKKLESNQISNVETDLMTLITTHQNLPYITLEAFSLIFKLYNTTKNISQLNTYLDQAQQYIFFNRIKTFLLIELYLYRYQNESNIMIKHQYLMQIMILKKFLYTDYTFSQEFIDTVTKEIPEEFKYFSSKVFKNMINNLIAKKTINNLSFLNSYNNKNMIFSKLVQNNFIEYYIFFSIDLLRFFNSNTKPYYFFTIKNNVSSNVSEPKNFTLFYEQLLPYTQKNLLYIQMQLENFYLVTYLSQKQFNLSLFLFIVLITFVFVTIILMVSGVYKEIKINKMKSNFISVVSHELKTPITAIQLFIESLMTRHKMISEDKFMDYMSRLSTETERLLYLINNLLAFSQNERNLNNVIKKSSNILKTLKEVIDFFTIDKKNMELILDFPKNDIIIEIDENAIKQVFYNLIDNAYKYSKDEKLLILKVKDSKNGVFISFKDNGIGLTFEETKLIFEKFYRGKETQSIPGTGLGLSLSKNIIDKHNGKIFVKSILNNGSTFIIFLPKQGLFRGKNAKEKNSASRR